MHHVYPILNKIEDSLACVCLCCMYLSLTLFVFLGFKQAITDAMQKLDDLSISKWLI